jgi:beta-glucosidase-like glycosyl hydrolase
MLPFAAMCATVPVRVEQLTLDEKIGQMFVPGGHGTFMAESSPRYQTLVHQVRDNRVGGIIWFVSNVYETALLNQRLQKLSRIPLLVSADLEAGVGMRFLDTTFWPSAMAIAATGDPAYAEKAGKVVAREARALGINHVLAPVADVNVNPDNPVINTRSFGEDPKEVGRFVAALIRGIQSERVLACAKHFPGHGDTHVDSHRSLPVLDVTRERLDRVELVPFRDAINAGVKSIMIGHLSIPALDATPAPIREGGHGDNPWGTHADEVPKEGTIPATISAPIIKGLLRKDLGFDGLVVTDAFDMGGLTEHFDAGEAAIRAIEAGEDQVLMSPNVDAAIAAVRDAVKSGRLSEARIDESVRRILDAKAFTGIQVPDTDEIFRTIDSAEHRALASDIASHALTLVREQAGALPLRRDARVVLVTVTDVAEGLNPLVELEKEMRARLTAPPQVIALSPSSAAPVLPENADAIVVALAVRARSGAGRIAVPQAAKDLIARHPSVIAISFGSPYLLREIPHATTYFCAYGIQAVMQVAAVQAIFGEAPVGGRLPVTIPGLYERGHGIARVK